MPVPDRAGRFNAFPVEIGIDETGPNNLVTVTIRYAIYEEFVQGQWCDVQAEGLEIVGYHYLEKRDGSINDRMVRSLREALNWPGGDLFWLEDNQQELAQKPVQIVLGQEEYQGEIKIKVQWLNAYGSSGGAEVSHASEQGRQAIRNRLGARLRALGGGGGGGTTTTQAPPRQAPPNTQPPPTQGPPKQSPPFSAVKKSSANEAWAAFNQTIASIDKPEGHQWTQDEIEQTWFEVLNALFPGKKPADLTPEDWAVFIDRHDAEIPPF